MKIIYYRINGWPHFKELNNVEGIVLERGTNATPGWAEKHKDLAEWFRKKHKLSHSARIVLESIVEARDG